MRERRESGREREERAEEREREREGLVGLVGVKDWRMVGWLVVWVG
jgi:hypothetical protein